MIAVIGLGFVGLTTALGFCEKGFSVIGYDIDQEKCNNIKNGCIPFYEPHLDKMLDKHITKNLWIAESIQKATKGAQVIFYCVGTPANEDGSANLQHLYAALEATLKCIDAIDEYRVIVVKSTVPPSTTSNKVKPFIETRGFKTGDNLGLANNPEFLREGYAWGDFIEPDRIVIGTEDAKSKDLLQEIYAPFHAPIYWVSLNTAEFIKYLSNTFLSTLISYANDMSMVAEAIGDIDIPSAFKILHQDKRWYGQPASMTSYVYPGCGYGGYCLPKDTKAMYMASKAKGYESHILKHVIEINSAIKDFVVNKIATAVKKQETIGILGLAFKANSDDVRETPAKDIIEKLLTQGYQKIIAYDPVANTLFDEAFKLPIEFADSMDELLYKANNVVILTGWDEFKKISDRLKGKTLFDFRYLL